MLLYSVITDKVEFIISTFFVCSKSLGESGGGGREGRGGGQEDFPASSVALIKQIRYATN